MKHEASLPVLTCLLVIAPLHADAQTGADGPVELRVEQGIIALPDLEIPPQGKAVFNLHLAEEQLQENILLRLEAVLRFPKEAGYDYPVRIVVNGHTVDSRHHPVNVKTAFYVLPNIPKRAGTEFPLTKGQKWVVAYDADRYPPTKESMYYAPERESYVYLFPVKPLLKPAANEVVVENTHAKYALRLLSSAHCVTGLRITRSTCNSIELAWNSAMSRYEIDWRPAGQANWRTVRNVFAWESPYNVIMLNPETEYELRVRSLLPAQAGQVRNTQPEVIRGKTSALTARVFSGMRLCPTDHLPGAATYPCIESHAGFLWVTDNKLGLLKLDPDTKRVLWQRKQPLAKWPLATPRGYMGVVHTAIVDDAFFVTYSVQDTRNPKGYRVGQDQSRQYLLRYDFATDTTSEPVQIPPAILGHGVIFGSLAVWRGQLWLLQRDEWLDNGKRRHDSLLALRTFENGTFAEPIIYENSPTPACWGLSLSVFNDRLVLMFSDLVAPIRQGKNQETLYCALFDGSTFSRARAIQDIGRSRYAKGVQMGDRFVCVYKCSMPYYRESGYNYHDIALSVFRPGETGDIQTVMYVNDRKYNSSPSITLHDGRAIVIYNKFEHSYGIGDNPALFYGDFIGEIIPDPAPAQQ